MLALSGFASFSFSLAQPLSLDLYKSSILSNSQAYAAKIGLGNYNDHSYDGYVSTITKTRRFQKGAKVYILTRSETKAKAAIEIIKSVSQSPAASADIKINLS